MMRVYLSPQMTTSGEMLEYTYSGEVVQVSYTDTEGTETIDSIDFSTLPEGSELTNVETVLPVNPFIGATRKNGFVEVMLLNWIGDDATESEKFPEWLEV